MALQESILYKRSKRIVPTDSLFLSYIGEKQSYTFSINTTEEADVNRVLYIPQRLECVTTAADAVWPQSGEEKAICLVCFLNFASCRF